MKTLAFDALSQVEGGKCPEGYTAIPIWIIWTPTIPGIPAGGQFMCVPNP